MGRLTVHRAAIISIIIIFLCCSGDDNRSSVRFESLLHDTRVLKQVKKDIQNNDKRRLPAYQLLINTAEEAVSAGPFSVVFDELIPPSGDKHDYASMGPYWWPNPDSIDGLPYIRRDGQVNPERINYDKIPMATLGETVSILALAYYFTDDERYAKKVAILLRTWFIDPDTKMNPNLNYGQFIPGRSAGRGVGIIESRVLIDIGEVLALIGQSPCWNDVDQRLLTVWYNTFLDWLLTSPIGEDESDRSNNHGTWYDNQVAYLALQTGREDIAEQYLRSIIDRRIPEQIAADGSQPHELKRTRTLSYTKFNLRALITAARLGDKLELDIWKVTNGEGGNIAAAIDFLADNAVDNGPWPFEQITYTGNADLISLMSLARDKYDDVRYSQTLRMLPLTDRIVSRENLLRMKPTYDLTEQKLEINANSVELK